MKHFNLLPLITFSVLLFSSSVVFAQERTYFLNKDRKICGKANAVYSRTKISRYLHGGISTDYGGTPGFTIFEMTERYYPSGVVALTTYNIEEPGNPWQLDCFDGETTWYYSNGNIREKGFYSFGKKKGEFTYYDKTGKLLKTEYYEDDKLIDKDKFKAPGNSPFLGKWQFVRTDFTTYRFSHEFFRDGTSRYQVEFNNPVWGWSPNYRTPKIFNWKYKSISPNTGMLEQFQGNDLVNRYFIQWNNPNLFTAVLEYTTEYVFNKSRVYYFERVF